MRRLFFDIETSPNVGYFWQSGYKLFIPTENIVRERAIICICYKWGDEDDIYSLEWNKGDDKKLVKSFSKIIDKADELVAHNGDRFDIKWFNGRHLFHGLDPIPQYKTIDTLKIARKYFKLNSNKLDYLSRLLLGEGKAETQWSLWSRVMDNEPSAMKEMVSYCKKDVLLLERVYKRLSSYDTPKTHAGVMMGRERWTCKHCGSESVVVSKTNVTSAGIIQKQMKCGDCHRYYSIAESVWKNYLADKVMEG